jgi:hypothetical protein
MILYFGRQIYDISFLDILRTSSIFYLILMRFMYRRPNDGSILRLASHCAIEKKTKSIHII